MTDKRDICERLEDQSIDGAIFLRLNAAKEITALRYYVARLEGDLASEEYQHARTKIQLENAQEHISDQALDIVTLGQEVGRLREALTFYAEAWACKTTKPRLGGVAGLEWRPKDDLLEDCGNTARAALAEKEENP